MRAHLRFAQLSDPHLSSPAGVHWRDLANKRLLGYLSWRRRRRAEHRPEVLEAMREDLARVHPEHVVVTGDLTHIGLPAEIRQARAWLERLGPPREVTVVPGNHDAYVALSWRRGWSQWRPYMASDPGRATPGDGDGVPFPSLRVRGPVAFIGVSSARPSAPFLAVGEVGEAQLERLGRTLDETRREGLFRVVLLHHPPLPGQIAWRKRLIDAARLCQVIARHGAELVLHGHGHRRMQGAIPTPRGDVPVLGVPSASYTGERPGRTAQYDLFGLRRGARGWVLEVEMRVYSGEARAFRLGGTRRLILPYA